MIKKILIATGLMTSLFANASSSTKFDKNALLLLNAVHQDCPVQFIQSMTGANSIASATFVSDRPGETYTINTVHQAPAPSFKTTPVATLKIVRTVVKDSDEVQAADKPTTWNVQCQLSFAKDQVK